MACDYEIDKLIIDYLKLGEDSINNIVDIILSQFECTKDYAKDRIECLEISKDIFFDPIKKIYSIEEPKKQKKKPKTKDDYLKILQNKYNKASPMIIKWVFSLLTHIKFDERKNISIKRNEKTILLIDPTKNKKFCRIRPKKGIIEIDTCLSYKNENLSIFTKKEPTNNNSTYKTKIRIDCENEVNKAKKLLLESYFYCHDYM